MKSITLFASLIFSTLFMANAQTQHPQYQTEPSISVNGEGIVSVVPDKATIKVRVEETGDAAQEVKSKTDVAVDNVIKFLRKMDVEEKHIQTDYIRLDKSYNYNDKTYSYKSNQSISIQLEDLRKYESIMNGLIQSGINRIDGIQFGSSDLKTLQTEARKKAVKDAKEKAKEFVSVLDQKVGKAISISEVGNSSQPQPRMMMAMEASMSDGQETQETLAKGEMQIKVNVNITFQLK